MNLEVTVTRDSLTEQLLNLNLPSPYRGFVPNVFAKILMEWLPPVVSPGVFISAAELTLYSLESGLHEPFFNRRLEGQLSNQPSTFYDALKRIVPVIAKAVFPPQFAARVEELYCLKFVPTNQSN